MRKRIIICVALILVSISFLSVHFLMDAKNPRIYFLYTLHDGLPEVLFKVSSVPLAIASFVKYRNVSFVAEPITDSALKAAFLNAHFLVIGTHGYDGKIMTDDHKLIGPSLLPFPSMQLVFFGSCDVGLRQKEWEAQFPNARIKSYDRPMYPVEGWIYLFFQASFDLMNMRVGKNQ